MSDLGKVAYNARLQKLSWSDVSNYINEKYNTCFDAAKACTLARDYAKINNKNWPPIKGFFFSKKTKKLPSSIIKNIEYLNKVDDTKNRNLKEVEEERIIYVSKNGYNIKNIINPSKNVQLAAVRNNGFALEYIDDPSDEVILSAIKNNGLVIQLIKNPSESLQKEAIKYYPKAIKYIKNPSKGILLEAVKKDGMVIRYIENPSKEIQIEALMENPNSIKHIKKLNIR